MDLIIVFYFKCVGSKFSTPFSHQYSASPNTFSAVHIGSPAPQTKNFTKQ